MISSEDLEQAIERISKLVSNGKLTHVHHFPSPQATATNCISNVSRNQEKYGGRSEFGWTFLHRCSELHGDYLILTHHCVWFSPNGVLVDITPFHKEPKHQPINLNSKVLFLVDQNAKPLKIDNLVIPLPSKFFAIRSKPSINNYVKKLQEKELQYYKDEFGIEF